MEKSSELLKEYTEKIKVSSAEIVVHGSREKPYYEIKYHDLSDGQIHIGYSSYNLDFVFDWLEECFEIVNQAADTIESLSAKLQAANDELERWHTDHINEKIKNPFAWTSTLICHNCDHKDEYIEELEAEVEELKAENMEQSSEDCGRWIPCSEPPKHTNEVLIFNGKSYCVGYYDGKTWINAIHPVEWREIRHEP